MMRLARVGAGLLVGTMALATASAGESCGLCASEVVISPPLATCLLSQYEVLATGDDGGAIAVDLSECEQERGIIEALPSLTAAPPEPDLQFFLSRRQLDCLKTRLETPGAVEPPVSVIDLRSCQ
ncbi:hypothetical protein [Aquibium sp. ELW1220]|jgi:hypothetical protein|uniref:hypothetical protein n=1 Tax=Aquibium sp. ELW1220 TaxID=2976766 RepID=UPI0025B0DF32|nr:hypothetical protein [Aquibium sp. ELW1220]MDN2582320.1 hypothetical protein [Aquibium sp. ELW1220]